MATEASDMVEVFDQPVSRLAGEQVVASVVQAGQSRRGRQVIRIVFFRPGPIAFESDGVALLRGNRFGVGLI